MLLTGGGNMLGISPANASACQQGWYLLVKTSVASPKERREELRERERAWLEDEMRRETIVQDWKKALDQRWGEVRQLDSYLIFVFFNYRNQMSVLEPSQPLDFNLVGPVKDPRSSCWKTGLSCKLPKLGNLLSRLLQDLRSEEWSIFTKYTNRHEGQLNSRQ